MKNKFDFPLSNSFSLFVKSLCMLVFTLAFLVFFKANTAQARWATYDDAATEVIKSNMFIRVNKDGTSENIIEKEEIILREQGRVHAANYVITYNGDSSRLKILEAKTIYKDKEYKVDLDMIEDKPLASSHQGFDQVRQVLIAYPKAEIGAKIYIKYKLEEYKVPLPNAYFNRIELGLEGYTRNAIIEISSQIPLKYYANDPNKALKISTSQEKNTSKIKITLERPIFTHVINEPIESTVLNNKHITSISISSLDKWKEIGKRLGVDYTKVIKQPLPKAFEDIVKDVKNAQLSEEKQIEKVISLLNDKIRYMGDWRTVNGRMMPRDLEKIAESQIGDCKDFSASTAAILNKLGFNAKVAFVMRGILRQSYNEPLANLYSFNHAMLKVVSKNGKVYWIDPTNIQSMAGGIFPDIADKKALIVDIKAPSYETIPMINPNHSQLIFNEEIKFKSNGDTLSTGNLIMKGEEALSFAGAGLYLSKKKIENILFFDISGTYLAEEDKKSIEVPDLTKREVRDIAIKYTYGQKNRAIKTNVGQALSFPSNRVSLFTQVAHDQVRDIYVGIPSTLKRIIRIKDKEVKNIESLNYKITSPWLEVKRECNNNQEGTEIIDTIKILKSIIPDEEINSLAYRDFKNSLEKNMINVAVVFSN